MLKGVDVAVDETGVRTVTLSMHIGIACGVSYDVHVGLPGRRWEYFVAGDAIRGVAPILDEAKRGELAVTADVLRRLEAFPVDLGLVIAEHTPVYAILKSMTKVITFDEPGDFQMVPNNIHKLYINESALYRLLNGEGGLHFFTYVYYC